MVTVYILYFATKQQGLTQIQNTAVTPCPSLADSVVNNSVEQQPQPQVNKEPCFPDICGQPKRDSTQNPVQDSFEKIYANFKWGRNGGGSGDGSEPSSTISTRVIVELVIYKYRITSLLDAPCGAIVWTRLLLAKIFEKIPCFKYYGVDVVRSVISKLTEEFSPVPNMVFNVTDLSSPGVELPPGDLILCRDALQHLPYENIINILENYSKSKARYLIVGSYPKDANNENIPIGIIYFPIFIH